METIFELFDLDEDPDELHNLFTRNSNIAEQMKQELETKIIEINIPYT